VTACTVTYTRKLIARIHLVGADAETVVVAVNNCEAEVDLCCYAERGLG